jgi:hypothetical protein
VYDYLPVSQPNLPGKKARIYLFEFKLVSTENLTRSAIERIMKNTIVVSTNISILLKKIDCLWHHKDLLRWMCFGV